MGHFHASGKRYAEGTTFPAFGNTEGDWNPNGSEDLTAPALLPDTDGNRPFLFWDTGRRITTKRRVVWTFHHGDQWSTWNATAWYGPPAGDGPRVPEVSASAYWVGQGLVDATPIDGPGSSFVNGPGGELAWPYQGDDHLMRTEWGAVTLRARDHVQRNATDPLLDFANLVQLVAGGDDTGFCAENDDDVTAGSGITGLASLGGQTASFAQNTSAVLLAGYVTPAPISFQPPDIDKGDWHKYFDRGDPAAFRNIAEALAELAKRVQVESQAEAVDPIAGLAAAARHMDRAQLRVAIAEARSMLNRGEATLKAVEALAGKGKQQ